ncbi:MAG: hypothetical protein AAF488_09310 [Planctomycetota bacterium]
MRRIDRCDAGFSLIETLLATLLLGVTLVGITEALTVSLRSSKDSERYTRAVLIAEARVEEIRTEGSYLEGETTGSFDAFPGFEYTETISAGEFDGLYEVEVSVEHTETKARLYTLTTLLFELPYEADPYGVDPDGASDSSGDSGVEDGR